MKSYNIILIQIIILFSSFIFSQLTPEEIMTRRENEWIVLTGVSVVLVNLIIGWVNTTLHHEHAILSMFVLGLLIAQFRKTELIEELDG